MASYYYKKDFVSPVSIWAEVKEELSSYFLSGALDDMMFPKWTEKCLQKLGKSTLKIQETTLTVADYEACLPSDFDSIRELWMCTVYNSITIQNPSVAYCQSDCRVSIYPEDKCSPCFESENCSTKYMVTNKFTDTFYFSFEKTVLLKPGNLHAKQFCGTFSPNLYIDNCPHTFDVQGSKVMVNYPEGTLYLMYYSQAVDEDGEQLIPDMYRVKEFVRLYIIEQLFRKLLNITTDESINIVERKLQQAKQDSAEAFIMAERDLKTETIDRKIRKIVNSYNTNNKYRLPNG